MDNDIALIHLDTPASLNSDVQAIGIASSEPKTGAELLVSGWGNTHRKFTYSCESNLTIVESLEI